MLFLLYFMTWDADCLMDTERTTMVQRRPDIYNQYTKRIMNAMTKGSHPWGAGSISKRLFPLSEDAMRHLENGTAAMFDYLIHDGRKTIEFEELSTLIPHAWSINKKICERTKQYRRAVWFNGKREKFIRSQPHANIS